MSWIIEVAKDYIVKYLNKKQKKETSVFEYGSGGSSLFFLNNAAKVVSAEHNEEWFNKVKVIIVHRNIQGWEGCFSKIESILKKIID